MDKKLNAILEMEEQRQKNSLTMIASENYVFPGVYKYSGSTLTNKYSEGRVGVRYYGGTEYIDILETLCQDRALELFGLDKEVWGVCVQSYSGSIANLSAYCAMTVPGGKIMGLNLTSGGHLTHGFQTPTKKISASSLFFSSHPYHTDANGYIDYNQIKEQFNEVLPDVFVCGYSAYSQDIDYQKLKEITNGRSFLFSDISHISAIISAKRMNDPFEYSDVVMTTTHKGLRGPRGALLFYKRKVVINGIEHDMDTKINSAVFPLIQGGPHNQTIGGIAHALYMAAQPEFKQYINQVLSNAKELQEYFTAQGYKLVTESTVNHMLLIDLTNKGVRGADVEYICDLLGININKNTVPKDKSPLSPSGIRIGTYAITTRGLKESETNIIATVINYVVQIAQLYQSTQTNTVKETIKEWLIKNSIQEKEEFIRHQETILSLAKDYPIPFLSST
ncbi:glycine hydroxymethyltransferase [Nematocida sp. AWRm80]|nr:glycine hydroxymethyltransferase [Nematocida sp. AWRm80]